MKRIIEICANSAQSCVEAEAGGATRVELCAGIPEGGTTPSYGDIVIAREVLQNTRLHVIIRPRSGDFLYSPIEQRIMLKDIDNARRLGADGIVLGCLTADGEVDIPLMKKFMEAVQDISVTFHRAFDMCRDPFQALQTIEKLGCARILTSGQSNSAETGLPLLKELVARARNVIIMPGCGVNAANVRKIAESTGAFEFHLSARIRLGSDMVYRNPAVSMGGTVQVDEYGREVSSSEKVEEGIRRLEY